MDKGRSQPVIWFLLNKKLEIKDIVALGYSQPTVWRYHSRFNEVMQEFKDKLAEHKAIQRNKWLYGRSNTRYNL